jgi:hypothetical protein
MRDILFLRLFKSLHFRTEQPFHSLSRWGFSKVVYGAFGILEVCFYEGSVRNLKHWLVRLPSSIAFHIRLARTNPKFAIFNGDIESAIARPFDHPRQTLDSSRWYVPLYSFNFMFHKSETWALEQKAQIGKEWISQKIEMDGRPVRDSCEAKSQRSNYGIATVSGFTTVGWYPCHIDSRRPTDTRRSQKIILRTN